VTVPENVNTIYSMILDDRRVSAKNIAETLEICRGRVNYIIQKILKIRKLSSKWFQSVSMLVRSMIECLLHKPLLTDLDGMLWDS
jgi:hypothetical protein